ncbi:helix-turn-helix domain-containing protein [Cellulomonas sp. URHB0016]
MVQDERVPVATAARILGVHPQTVRRWSRAGMLPTSWTPGGERRFLVRDLDDFARSHQAPPRKTRTAP